MTYSWPYVVCSSNICAKLCTNMPWSIWKRLVQKKIVFFVRSTVILLLTFLNGCDWSDTLSALAPVLGPSQKSWLCHPLPLFMAVSMIAKTLHTGCYYMRHSWMTKKWGFMLEPARIFEYSEGGKLVQTEFLIKNGYVVQYYSFSMFPVDLKPAFLGARLISIVRSTC